VGDVQFVSYCCTDGWGKIPFRRVWLPGWLSECADPGWYVIILRGLDYCETLICQFIDRDMRCKSKPFSGGTTTSVLLHLEDNQLEMMQIIAGIFSACDGDQLRH